MTYWTLVDSGASVSRAFRDFEIDDCCDPGPACALVEFPHSGASVSRASRDFKIDDCCGPGPACASVNF